MKHLENVEGFSFGTGPKDLLLAPPWAFQALQLPAVAGPNPSQFQESQADPLDIIESAGSHPPCCGSTLREMSWIRFRTPCGLQHHVH